MSLRLLAIAAFALAACQGSPLPALPALPLPPVSLSPVPSAVAGSEQRPRADAAELTRRVDALVAEFSGKAAAWIADAGDPRPLYAREPDEPVLAASLWKLGALVHVESLVEGRGGAYADMLGVEPGDATDGSFVIPGDSISVDDALELMITQSDNGTALAFWRVHGGAAMNATLQREGIGGLHVGEDANEDNTVTARGVGTLMQRLAERKLVSPAASDRMVARLERQAITGRSDARLPPDTRLAHKTGDIAGASHDAAIVWTAIGPRIVVVLTWDAEAGAAHELIARIAEAAFVLAR